MLVVSRASADNESMSQIGGYDETSAAALKSETDAFWDRFQRILYTEGPLLGKTKAVIDHDAASVLLENNQEEEQWAASAPPLQDVKAHLLADIRDVGACGNWLATSGWWERMRGIPIASQSPASQSPDTSAVPSAGSTPSGGLALGPGPLAPDSSNSTAP
jgi:hypothetical protein